MARGRNNPRGSRVGNVFEEEGVALVNRSNIDVQCNDPDPPHGVVTWRAGHISPDDPTRNCVQFFTRSAALKFIIKVGEALEPLSVENGKLLLLEARKAGNFESVYQRFRGPIIDLTHLPAEVMARENLRRALKAEGMRESDIPAKATLSELRKLHSDFTTGRHHLRLVELENARPEVGDGPMRALDLTPARTKADDLAEIQLLRGRCDELGLTWHPGWKQPRLRQAISERENALQVSGKQASKPGITVEELAQIHAAATPLPGAGEAEGVHATNVSLG